MLKKKKKITVEVVVNAPIEKVWKSWTEPKHITKWCFASDDWQAPRALNDLKVGGKFVTRMEAKDGKAGFDFGGTYTKVTRHAQIEYVMGGDGRLVKIEFEKVDDGVKVSETFEAEDENSLGQQKTGWQAILDNFKKYVESV